jgi:hypothetical protein
MLTHHIVEQWMNRKLEHSAEVCERLSLRIVPASKQVCMSMYLLVCTSVYQSVCKCTGGYTTNMNRDKLRTDTNERRW